MENWKMSQKTIEYFLKLNYPVAFHKNDDGYEAWHPDFGRSAIIGSAKSLKGALSSLDRARKFFIEHLAKNSLDIPEPHTEGMEDFSGRFVVRVPKDLHAKLAREAHRNGVSLNSYIIHLLSEKRLTNGSANAPEGKTSKPETITVNGKTSRRKTVTVSS
jgi:predicted HicB family RNase H-like nuclease